MDEWTCSLQIANLFAGDRPAKWPPLPPATYAFRDRSCDGKCHVLSQIFREESYESSWLGDAEARYLIDLNDQYETAGGRVQLSSFKAARGAAPMMMRRRQRQAIVLVQVD